MKKNEHMPAMAGLTAEDCERAFRRCRKCRFRGAGGVLCDYAGITGHVRLKVSPGVGEMCTVFEKGDPPEMKPQKMTVRPNLEREVQRKDRIRRQMRELWEAGLNDREIGEEVNRSSTAVRAWRIKEGLYSNGPGRRGEGAQTQELKRKMLELYHRGMTDQEIGQEVGRSKKTVKTWRLTAGLESNYTRKGSRHEEDAYGGLGDPAELEQQKRRTGRTGENSG